MRRVATVSVSGALLGAVISASFTAHAGHEEVPSEQSEPQQLLEACKAAAWEKLLAPSTATLASFKVNPAGVDSVIGAKLKLGISSAEADIAKLDELKKEIDGSRLTDEGREKVMARVRRGEISEEEALEGLARLSQTNLDLLLQYSQELKKAHDALVSAKKALAEHDAKGLGEVILTVDAQNRYGAMLRMQAVCTWSQGNSPEASAASVTLAELGERGDFPANSL